MAFTPARVLYAYGLFLMAGGILAFAMAGFEARAKTAVIMGFGCGLSVCACAYWASLGRPAAVSVGRGLATFFLALFSWRAFKIIGVAEKAYLLNTFILLSIGSALAAVLLSLATPLVKAQRNNAAAAASASRGAKKSE